MDNPVLDAARAKRAKHQSKLDSLLETPTAEARSLTDTEATEFEELAAKITKLDSQISLLEAEEARKVASATATAAIESTPVFGEQVRVTSEPMTYGPFGQNSYFRDMAMIAMSTRDSAYSGAGAAAVAPRRAAPGGGGDLARAEAGDGEDHGAGVVDVAVECQQVAAAAAELRLHQLLVGPGDGPGGLGRARGARLHSVEGAAEELHSAVMVLHGEGEEVGVGVEDRHVGRVDAEQVLEGVVGLRVVPAGVEGHGAVEQGRALLLEAAPLALERSVCRVEAPTYR